VTRPRVRILGEYYVYVAFYPNGTPCYVGKGKGERWRHCYNNSHNRRLARVAKKNGGDIPVVIVQKDLNERQAFALEKLLIQIIGRQDLCDGPLVNSTDGGEGDSGATHTEETKKRMSAIRVGKSPSTYPNWRSAMETSWRDPERLRKLSEKSKALKTITDGVVTKRVSKDAEIPEGWHPGTHRTAKGKIWITNGETNKVINADDIIPSGWRKGATMPKRGPYKDHPPKPPKLREKWEIGMPLMQAACRGSKWINNGISMRRLKPHEPFPDGWRYGKITQ
jgi:hypothetical protein